MRSGVVVFPGSNCDTDVAYALEQTLGEPVDLIWHGRDNFAGYDLLVLPGGFSYGDYLRAGAIARFAPAMARVADFAAAGGLVLGICNGFQILLEAGLLPGAMQQNASLRFRCQDVYLRVETTTPFTCLLAPGQVISLPIAHGRGNYFADRETLARLEERGQVVLRYVTREGEVTAAANPNGSLGNIAGISNERGNVLGLMPHPERAAEAILGGSDGALIFRSLMAWWGGEQR